MEINLVIFVSACLLGLSVIAIVLNGRRWLPAGIYGLVLILCALSVVAGLSALLTGTVQTKILPFGLPWLGAHLRLDGLTGFFLIVIGLGGGLASLYAIGYGRHEREPWRVLPFFPAFFKCDDFCCSGR